MHTGCVRVLQSVIVGNGQQPGLRWAGLAAVMPRAQVTGPKLERVLLVARVAGRSQGSAGVAGSGRCAVMVVPLLGTDRTSSRPSRAASLSAMLRWPDPIGVRLVS
jgi:hypothetical protein